MYVNWVNLTYQFNSCILARYSIHEKTPFSFLPFRPAPGEEEGERTQEEEWKGEEGGGRVERFDIIFWNQSFDLMLKKILLVPKIELVFAESTV